MAASKRQRSFRLASRGKRPAVAGFATGSGRLKATSSSSLTGAGHCPGHCGRNAPGWRRSAPDRAGGLLVAGLQGLNPGVCDRTPSLNRLFVFIGGSNRVVAARLCTARISMRVRCSHRSRQRRTLINLRLARSRWGREPARGGPPGAAAASGSVSSCEVAPRLISPNRWDGTRR